MRKRVVGGGLAGAVVIGILLGAKFGLPGLGTGSSGPGGVESPASTDPQTVPTATKKQEPAASPVVDGKLPVRIEADHYLIQDQQTSIASIIKLAKDHEAVVVIDRAEDATRLAREQLEKALDKEQILYRVK